MLNTFINIVKLGRVIAHAVILVYLLGALFAVFVGASFNIDKFIVGYVILFTGTLAAIYTNNYNDVATDRFATHTFFSGGSSILIDHPELMRTTQMLARSLYAVSIFLGLLFMVVFSYPITFFIYVLLGNFIAWCYTSPPIKLVYRGFGELTTMVGGGFIIPGFAYFVIKGTIDASFVLFSIPLMLLCFALSLYLELPDRNADRLGQKCTLVARKSERFGFLLSLISSCLAISYLVLLAVFPILRVSLDFWLITLLFLIPVVVGGWSLIKTYTDSTKIMPIVFRTVTSIFLVFIVLDIYFVYEILT